MKHLREELWFNVPRRRDYLNITDKVEDLVTKSGVRNGLCLVNAMHITASVFINDDESGLHEDYARWLEQLAPFDASPQRSTISRSRRGSRRSLSRAPFLMMGRR